jgi:hypothetical protein
MPMRLLPCSILVILLLSGVTQAQDSASVWLRVYSNLPNSLVLVDSTYAGRADGTLLEIPAGRTILTLAPNDVGAWDLRQPQKQLVVDAGDTVEVRLDFPYQYRIDSVPFGARVSVPAEDGRILGTTPLVYSSELRLRNTLLLSKEGYANAEIEPGDQVINRHSVALQAMAVDVLNEGGVEWAPKSSRNTWINWAAAGVAVAGGALAVHFKFQADAEYDRYLESGDPTIKDQVDRLDRYSYFALGAMQVGIGVLAIRLAF